VFGRPLAKGKVQLLSTSLCSLLLPPLQGDGEGSGLTSSVGGAAGGASSVCPLLQWGIGGGFYWGEVIGGGDGEGFSTGGICVQGVFAGRFWGREKRGSLASIVQIG